MAIKKEIIIVNEDDLDISTIRKQGDEASIEDVVGAIAILDDQIATCKAVKENLEQIVNGRSLDTICAEIATTRGLYSTDFVPVIEVHMATGETVAVTLSTKTSSGFDASGLKDKAVLDTVVPDKYKKYSVTLDTKALEEAFNNGTLEDLLKSYCSVSPTTITAMRRTKVKGD